MHDELIGYLLGALDDMQQKLVEEYLVTVVDARSGLDILRGALEPLEADDQLLDPPTDLAARTCHYIWIHVQQGPANSLPRD